MKQILGLCLIVVSAAGAFGAPTAEDRFTRLDRDGDGRLGTDELQRPGIFQDADADGDGFLTRDEVRAWLVRRRRQQAEAAISEDKMPPMPEVAKHLNLPYAKVEGVDPNLLALDLYAPAKATKCPVIVMVHGGGWAIGDKAGAGMTQLKVPHFVGKGWVYVSLNYRLTPKVVHPVHTEDVAAALAWLHDHVAEYGGDPDRIFIMGHSAGSHLVSLVATDERYLKAHGKDLRIIKGVVALDNPGFDIPALLKVANPGLARIYEAAFTTDIKAQRHASPITYVATGKHIPPFLMIPSDERSAAHLKIIEDFAKALAKIGVPAGIVVADGKNHGLVNRDIGKVGNAETRIIMAFLTGTNPRKLPARTDEVKASP